MQNIYVRKKYKTKLTLHSALFTKKHTPTDTKKASVRGVDIFRTVPPGRFTSFSMQFCGQVVPHTFATRPFSNSRGNGLFSVDARRVGRVFAVWRIIRQRELAQAFFDLRGCRQSEDCRSRANQGRRGQAR